MNQNEFITEELPRDLLIQGSKLPIDTDINALEDSIRKAYGISYEEFADIHNEMLLAKNKMMRKIDFHNALLNKIIIDLVGREYLKIKVNINENFKYILTKKAINEINKYDFVDELNDPFQKLLFLRNYGLLKI